MLRKLFVKFHGEGEAHQADLYRCITCGSLVTWNKIRSGELCCGGRVRPSNPTLLEKIQLLVAPWTI